MFTPKLFSFLEELTTNNNREWFNEHKEEYEECVRAPALRFIEDFKTELESLSPYFLAIPKKVGGSMMRPYRDARFAKDKTPYKTNVGIQFRHQLGKSVHAPGYYLHISPKECFIGAGIWRPESKGLKNIRELIDNAPGAWKKIKSNKQLNSEFEFVGESLTNPPRGYSKEHQNINDLKRKDFILVSNLTKKDLYSKNLPQEIAQRYRKAKPLMRFLCEAQNLNF